MAITLGVESRGLNDVLVEQGYTDWCDRCQMFKLHEQSGDCRELIVGPRPAGTVCVDKQPDECSTCTLGPCTTDAECGGANVCRDGCCIIG